MPTLFDARGNEYQGYLDQVGGGVVTDARVASATLGALNAELLMDLNGKAAALFEIRTVAMSGTLTFEATADGTTYYPVAAMNPILETMLSAVVISTTHAAMYIVGCSGYRRVRVRVSTYTSGNCVVVGRASSADYAIYARPIPATLHVTVTAAANTAATLTIPAAGAGLYHYITWLHLTRNATAALAGTATLIATSTNLPGTPAWSYGNAMVAGGTAVDVDYQPVCPLKSLIANTPTTIVQPAAGLAVLNRGNVSYYVGA